MPVRFFFLHIFWDFFSGGDYFFAPKKVGFTCFFFRIVAKLLYHLKVIHVRILQHHLVDEIKVCVCIVFARISSSFWCVYIHV